MELGRHVYHINNICHLMLLVAGFGDESRANKTIFNYIYHTAYRLYHTAHVIVRGVFLMNIIIFTVVNTFM